MTKEYTSFKQFYPFYLSQHQNKICRRLHIIAAIFIIILFIYTVATGQWRLFVYMPIIGYGFAWIGHYIFEENRPATFTYPFYSLLGDWVMFRDVIIGKIKF
jgi:hypothetical protein